MTGSVNKCMGNLKAKLIIEIGKFSYHTINHFSLNTAPNVLSSMELLALYYLLIMLEFQKACSDAFLPSRPNEEFTRVSNF